MLEHGLKPGQIFNHPDTDISGGLPEYFVATHELYYDVSMCVDSNLERYQIGNSPIDSIKIKK